MKMTRYPVTSIFSTYNQDHMHLKFINRLTLDIVHPKQLFRALALLALCMSASTQTVAAATADGAEVAGLKRGEILAETIHTEKSGGAARVTALFHTDVDTIWNTIGYCKYEFIYVRGLESCGVLIPGLQLTRKHHRVKNSWYSPTLDFTFEAKRTTPTHGEFRLVEGDLKAMEGQWDFQALAGGDGFVVTHEIRIQPKIPAPRWLVRRVLKSDLPDMMACIRGLAQASGDDELLADDLGRCPGDTSQATK